MCSKLQLGFDEAPTLSCQGSNVGFRSTNSKDTNPSNSEAPTLRALTLSFKMNQVKRLSSRSIFIFLLCSAFGFYCTFCICETFGFYCTFCVCETFSFLCFFKFTNCELFLFSVIDAWYALFKWSVSTCIYICMSFAKESKWLIQRWRGWLVHEVVY